MPPTEPAPLPMSEQASGENQHKRMAPWKPSDTIDQYLNGNPGGWDWCLIDNLDPDDCRAIAIESIRRLAASEATALALHAENERLTAENEDPVRSVGRFAAYGHDGCGWLAHVECFVRVDDYEKGEDYVPDEHHLFATIAEQATTIATLEGALRAVVERADLFDHEHKTEWGQVAWSAASKVADPARIILTGEAEQ